MLPLLPVVALAVQVFLHWDYTSAAAATTECYARTLAGGGGLALQQDAIVSSGFGSLIWVALLACAALVGLPVMTTAKLVGALLAALALYLLPAVSRRLNGRDSPRLVDLLPSLMLAIHPALMLHAADGLETSLNLLLLVAALRLYVREEQAFEAGVPGSCLGSLVPMLLLLLARPEAPVWLGALMVGRALARAAGHRVPRWTFVWFLLPLAGYGLQLVWSYITFADPWPAVLTARMIADAAPAGRWSALAIYHEWGLTVPLLAVAVVGALRQTTYWARIALAGLGLATVAVVAATGGDAELGCRALPAALALAILTAEGIDLIASRLGGLARWIPVAIAAGLLAHPLGQCWRIAVERPSSPLRQSVSLAATVEGGVHAVGLIPEQVRVLTRSPGAFALRGFKVVDYSGLTDPAIRRYRSQPRELRHLIFQDRRPDVLVQRESSRRGTAQEIIHFPEAGRSFVVPPTIPVGFSRRLLLEPTPWGEHRQRQRVDKHLWLVGVRPLPNHRLLLLWMADRNRPPQRDVEVSLGSAWKARVPVGPPIYPMERWRGGEVVRQMIMVPASMPAGQHKLWLRIGTARERMACGSVDADLLKLDRHQWQHHHIRRVTARQGWEGVERLLHLWRDPSASEVVALKHVGPRIRALMRRGLTTRAAEQLAQAQAGRAPSPELRELAAELADQTYQRALRHIRQSRWSLAAADLRAAALARPGSPWIHRRLEQAQKRLPEGDYLIRALELEVAQRAMVLEPSGPGLARVMRAHLALGQPQAAVLAFHGWTRTALDPPEPTDRSLHLLAKAQAAAGRLELALDLAEQQVAATPRQLHPRRCPPWSAIQPVALRARLKHLLKRPLDARDQRLLLEGEPQRLSPGTVLVAHCARWSAGNPVEVVLYLQRGHAARDLPLELAVGKRRQRLVVTRRGSPLRRVVARMLMPPATYPVQLHAGKTQLALGQVTVGPEANFGFELPRFTSWAVQGDAFGRAPVVARSPRWHVIYGHIGERYVDSYATGSDLPFGRLVSPPFKLRKDHLMLLIAGGDHPTLGVDLLVEGTRRITVRGDRSLVLRPVFLPVARFRGRWARVMIRDESSAHWGYLAVDEIRQLDGPARGVAP